ncbi:ABC transporter permease [Bacillus sp. YC2]|uniref:ABC transporter permease n=1 Tax=Bacillus sp. YC2 TaxID=2861287 RepID=UPI001CA67FE4|nr:ABC transporter permease subunit [Bacillus sp. YC2]MBY8911888.1 ABC transporter permease [Bacillus sp. YC2]
MRVLMAVMQKEWLESWKNGKLIWLPVAMMIIGIMEPLSVYYMPDIIAHAGNLPAGSVIDIPKPAGNEVMISTLSQFSLIGTALFIFSVMGSVVQERNQGILSLIMSRPVSAFSYIAGKWIVQSFICIGAFAGGSGLAYYYIRVLFEQTVPGRFLPALGVYALWVLFVVTCGLAASTFFRSQGAAAAAGIGLAAAISLAASLFPDEARWLPSELKTQADYMLMHGKWGDFFNWSLSASVLCVMLLAASSIWRFHRYETY